MADKLHEEGVHEAQCCAELARRWLDRGHNALTPDELEKKLCSIRKIKAMLQRKGSGDAAFGSISLQDAARWEAETLDVVKRGNVEEFSRRLSSDRRASLVSDERDRTALHHSAATGNLTLVKMIVSETPTLDEKDKDGRTPIFFALAAAHDEVVAWLIDEGAAVDVVDSQGVTPLHVAVHTNNRHCTRLLLETGRVNANSADEKGATPLHVAAHRACTEIVELLLEAGADPKAKDLRGNLPSALAERMDKAKNTRRLSTLSSVSTMVKAAVRFQAAGLAGGSAK